MTRRTITLASIFSLAIISWGTYLHVTEHARLSVAIKPTCSLVTTLPTLSAKAVYAYDVVSGEVLFEKNAEAQLPLASLTKLVTALTASETLAESDRVVITEQALLPEGDSGFTRGETWEARDLASFTLITSSNDGARALALAATEGSLDTFIERMNIFVKKAGLAQTFFLNDTGLDISRATAGSYGSARDIALLLAYGYKESGETLVHSAKSAEIYRSLSGEKHTALHTSTIPGTLPGMLVAKTGFTDLAGGNLALLFEALPGRPVALVILGATRETRDADMLALSASVKEALKRVTLCERL